MAKPINNNKFQRKQLSIRLDNDLLESWRKYVFDRNETQIDIFNELIRKELKKRGYLNNVKEKK